MSESVEVEKKRVDLVINPDYLQELKMIQATARYQTLSSFIQDVLSGKSIQRDNAKRLESNITHHLNTVSTQGLNNFQKLVDIAMSCTVPKAYQELESLRSKLHKGHTDEVVESFDNLITNIREKIELLVEQNRFSGIDQSNQVSALKSNLAVIDIHGNLQGSKCNLCLRLNADTYSKYFINNKNKKDPYNRRAFKYAIEKNIEFTINTLNPNIYEFIMNELTILDELNAKFNEALLKGQATGITEMMKTFVESKVRITKKLEAEVVNVNRT